MPVARVIIVTDSDICIITNSDLDSGDMAGPKHIRL
jgi:hypothetical protein